MRLSPNRGYFDRLNDLVRCWIFELQGGGETPPPCIGILRNARVGRSGRGCEEIKDNGCEEVSHESGALPKNARQLV